MSLDDLTTIVRKSSVKPKEKFKVTFENSSPVDTGFIPEIADILYNRMTEFEKRKLKDPKSFNISLLVCLQDTQISYQEIIELFKTYFTQKNLTSYFEYRVITPYTKKDHAVILKESLQEKTDILFIIGNLKTPLSISCGIEKQGTHTVILPLSPETITNFLENQLKEILSINVQDNTFELQF